MYKRQLHVHDLADNVTAEAERAGAAAAVHALKGPADDVRGGCEAEAGHMELPVAAGGLAGYVVPSRLTRAAATKLFFRVQRPVDAARLVITCGDEVLFTGKPRAFKPSIMESAPLTAKMIERAHGTVTLSVEPIEEM